MRAQLAVAVAALVAAGAGATQSCDSPCVGGAHGLGSIMSRLHGQDICANYASRVIDASTAVDCGHVDLADALFACGNLGSGTPPQCYTHRSAGIGIIVAQNVAAASIWIPVAWKILQMRKAKLE